MSNIIDKITVGETEYDIQDSEGRSQLKDHNWRLVTLENHLGLDSSIRTVSGNVATIDIPENARQYAKIESLFCGTLNYIAGDSWFPQGVTAIRVLNEAGNLIRKYDIPVASLPDYGWGKNIDMVEKSTYYPIDHYNKIVFENGRAYYHHLVYRTARDPYSEEYEKRNAEDTEVDYCACDMLLTLAEPEVIDITETLDFDGYLDLSDGAQIVFDLLESYYEGVEERLQAWYAAHVSVMFDLA